MPKVKKFNWDTLYIFISVNCTHSGLHSDPKCAILPEQKYILESRKIRKTLVNYLINFSNAEQCPSFQNKPFLVILNNPHIMTPMQIHIESINHGYLLLIGWNPCKLKPIIVVLVNVNT